MYKLNSRKKIKTIDLELAGKKKKASYQKFIKNFDSRDIKELEKRQLIEVLLPKVKRLVKLDNAKLQMKHTKNEHYSLMLTTIRLLNKQN